jgi:hypothetical protein
MDSVLKTFARGGAYKLALPPPCDVKWLDIEPYITTLDCVYMM